MHVALCKRRREDRVAPLSKKPYSYDDLDLDCCSAVAISGTGLPVRRRGHRERCSSLPEWYHQSKFETCLKENCDKAAQGNNKKTAIPRCNDVRLPTFKNGKRTQRTDQYFD